MCPQQTLEKRHKREESNFNSNLKIKNVQIFIISLRVDKYDYSDKLVSKLVVDGWVGPY